MLAPRVCRLCAKTFIPPNPRWSHCSLACRVFDKAEITDGCWLFRGARTPFGYGIIKHNGHITNAHHAAWIAAHGEVPTGISVLHRCDNPACCNPAHMFLGTQKDNMDDMNAKGRNGRRGKKGITDGQRAARAAQWADPVFRAKLSSVVRGKSNEQRKLEKAERIMANRSLRQR